MSSKIILTSALFFIVFQLQGQNYKFGKVSKEEVLQKEHPIQKEADAAILYRNEKVHYTFDKNNGFSLIKEVHERVKIYNKEGFGWATKHIRQYIGNDDQEKLWQLKGVTYNLVDGKLEEEKLKDDEIFDEESSKNWMVTTFTMPAVKEGSVIEYVYEIKSPFLGAIGKTPIQFTIPVDRLELDVEIPEYFYFSKYQNLRSSLIVEVEEHRRSEKHSYMSIERQSSSGFSSVSHSRKNNVLEYMTNEYNVNMDNIPALKVEAHVDHLYNYAAFLDWELQYTKFPNSPVKNYSLTWEGVAKSIYKDLGVDTQLNRDNYYDEDLDALLMGLSDPMMKAEKIFNYVKKKVKWNEYFGFLPDNGLKKAYREGSGNIGDINLLLISMMQYAKLNAHPVLVSTPSNGVPVFPTRDGFNYLIAALQIGDQIILFDASDAAAGPGELPKRARNWQGRLIIDGENSTWINLMPAYQSVTTLRMNLKLQEDEVIGLNQKVYSGLFAKEFRSEYTGPEDTRIQKRLGEISNAEISDYTTKDIQELGSEITESFNFILPGGLEKIGDKAYFKPLLFEGIYENPFKDDNRIYPVFYDFPELRTYSINIMIPDGYRIVSLPESIVAKLGEADGEFKFIVNGTGNVIRLSSVISIKKPVFLAEEYDFLKKFYANIIKKHSEAIVLEKTLEDGNSERAESGR